MNQPEPRTGALTDSLSRAVELAAARLLSLQDGAGLWPAPRAAAGMHELDAVLLCVVRGGSAMRDQAAALAASYLPAVLDRQLPDGGFATHPGGQAGADATIQGVLLLEAAGSTAPAEALERARFRAAKFGGLQSGELTVETRNKLAAFALGAFHPETPPAIELLLGPAYLASREPLWRRRSAVAIAAARAVGKPVAEWPFPSALSGSTVQPAASSAPARVESGWKAALVQVAPWLFRNSARAAALELLRSGVPGSAQEALFLAVGLRALGGPIDSGLKTSAGVAGTAGSRVWGDLALAAHAFLESAASSPDRDAAMKTLLPGPLHFRALRDSGHPSIDATALVLRAIAHVPGQDFRPAMQWLQAQQNRDGGWAACETGCPADPSCPAVTSHVLQALCGCGVAPDASPIARAVEFLAGTQANDGSWAPRWGGVHFTYATSQVLCGLRAAGVDDREASVLRAGEWMRSIQNADGGWGESTASRMTGTFTESPSTAVHTGWAVSGLLAGGDSTSESVRKGVDFLLKTQSPHGGWDEAPAWTPAPGEEALVSELASISIPLQALCDARHAKKAEGR